MTTFGAPTPEIPSFESLWYKWMDLSSFQKRISGVENSSDYVFYAILFCIDFFGPSPFKIRETIYLSYIISHIKFVNRIFFTEPVLEARKESLMTSGD